MKFLVLGASGMAGHTISIYLKEQGHDVLGFVRHEVPFVPCVVGDVMDTNFVRELIQTGKFDTVINCIGILNQSAEDHKEHAVFLNSYFPHFLAEVTYGMNSQVIHMSTDCVFSGKTGQYTEDSLRDGETFYDRTKALGELSDEKNLTLRNSIVGPDINANGIGLLNWFMKQSGEIKGYTHAMWTGMTTLQLAKIMEKAAIQRIHGLYNMVPEQNISKYELLKLFNHYLRYDEIVVNPFDGFSADKTLIRTKFDFAEIVPDYETMVSEMSEWIRKHAQLYPHYAL
ncbi:MAG: sugar nucleotide-binding protein [Oscillospiraceae bacterium]